MVLRHKTRPKSKRRYLGISMNKKMDFPQTFPLPPLRLPSLLGQLRVPVKPTKDVFGFSLSDRQILNR